MIFGFKAGLVQVDEQCRRLSFADQADGSGEHYFIMDRSEDSPDQAVPDMENVYIERDDQGWGGYGGSLMKPAVGPRRVSTIVHSESMRNLLASFTKTTFRGGDILKLEYPNGRWERRGPSKNPHGRLNHGSVRLDHRG
jgi:hypothetical protein